MKVFVITFKPHDSPDREIWAVFSTLEDAEESRKDCQTDSRNSAVQIAEVLLDSGAGPRHTY